MNAVIVEDSRLARKELKRLLSSYPQVQVVDEADNAEKAMELIEQHKPDLLFLDIDMPGKNGFELLEELEQVPLVIFTTAFNEFAIKAFEYNTLDYLLKPIVPQRLEQAIEKVERYLGTESTRKEDLIPNDQRIFIKDGERLHFVSLNRIDYFESCGNYTQVYFGDDKAMLHKAISKVEERLDPQLFLRANRQQIINTHFIESIEPWFNGQIQLTLKNKDEVMVSRRHARRLKQLFSF